ncbi:GNAT family N-acetyltransferase [Streptomyces caniferus]|uniref:GNAT family N-acetyltransferase n=1 Tax=Streptomyces caniferus TaxID=285557 RepID=UPI002E289E73|nr:GNAT family N-acetyltransferase [Streptomyces caniferus]
MTAAVSQHPLGLTVRPITGPDEVELFNQLPYAFNHEIADDLRTGRRRPEWLWVALHEGRTVARAGWWCRQGDERPFLLDVLDCAEGHEAAGRRLLGTALGAVVAEGAKPPQYVRLVPGDWRADPAVRPGIDALIALVEGQGATPFVERLRFQWNPGTPLAAPDPRLAFRAVAGREELVGLMTEVLDGTLDAHSLRDLMTMTPRQAAEEQYQDEMEKYSTPRDWWRVAVLPDGEPVGFVIAAKNSYHAIIAYIGIRRAHRGHGYIDALLAEGTRILATAGVPRIRATTDLGNTPMAAAFARAGYVNVEREIHYDWT